MNMKKILLSLAVAAMAVGCSKSDAEGPAGPERYGSLRVEAAIDAALEAVTRARVELPDGTTVPSDPMNELGMRVVSLTPGIDYMSPFLPVSNYNPKRNLLREGDYRLTFFSTPTYVGGVAHIEEGENKPYFESTVDVSVVALQQTQVTTAVGLANTIVRIGFTERFQNYFPNGATFTLKTAAGNSFEVKYTADDHTVPENYWFVRPATFTISGHATKQTPSSTADPQTVRFEDTVNSAVKPRTLYTYTFDVSGVGDTGEVIVTINDEPVRTELLDEELNDDSHI